MQGMIGVFAIKSGILVNDWTALGIIRNCQKMRWKKTYLFMENLYDLRTIFGNFMVEDIFLRIFRHQLRTRFWFFQSWMSWFCCMEQLRGWIVCASIYYMLYLCNKLLRNGCSLIIFIGWRKLRCASIFEQAGAELSQAQPKLRFRLRLNDFQIWRYGWLDKLTNLSMYEV